MAVPKSRTSKAKRDRRRSHDHLTTPSMSKCPQCEAPKLPHRICPSCGSYKGRTILKVDDE
jgi:large subunit ribosomal protein L32